VSFKFDVPTIRGARIDGVHDLLPVLVRSALAGELSTVLPMSGLAALALGLVVRHRHRLAPASIRGWFRTHVPYQCLVLGAGFVAVAVGLDEVPSRRWPDSDRSWLKLVEEVFELNGGICFVLASLAIRGAPALRPRLGPPGHGKTGGRPTRLPAHR
jgi:hypothetical protein